MRFGTIGMAMMLTACGGGGERDVAFDTDASTPATLAEDGGGDEPQADSPAQTNDVSCSTVCEEIIAGSYDNGCVEYTLAGYGLDADPNCDAIYPGDTGRGDMDACLACVNAADTTELCTELTYCAMPS